MKSYYLLIPLLFQLFSCQKNEIKSKNTITEEESTVNFINYPIDDLEGITSEGHEGVYRNFDFNYTNGEAYFLLVPKIGANKWYSLQKEKYKDTHEDIDLLIEKKLNNMSFKLLSKDFNIWVFNIPKKYMLYTPNMDSPYTPKIPRTNFVYQYVNGKWNIVNKYIVNASKDGVAESKWRQNIINGIIDDTNKINVDYSRLKEKMQQDGYGVFKDINCDLNGDLKTDYILVFSSPSEELTKFITYLFLSKENEYIILKNTKAIQSNSHTTYAIGLENIAVKNNYFTLEENTSGGDPVQNIYTTFVYDKNTSSVKLHKYGIETSYPDSSINKDWNKIYSEKDFGNIRFQDFDSNTILEKINSK